MNALQVGFLFWSSTIVKSLETKKGTRPTS